MRGPSFAFVSSLFSVLLCAKSFVMNQLYIHWHPSPEIFSIGAFGPRWYGVLFAIAFVVGYYLMKHIFKREGVKLDYIDNLLLYFFIGTIVGARLGHCLFYEPQFYLSHPLQILKIWEGGLASHGAGIGLFIALGLFVHKYKVDTLWLFDRLAIMIALSGFFIRMGNLMNSEIVGCPTTQPWGFIFENNGEDFARHPSQLYEALGYLAMGLTLLWMYFKTDAPKRKGLIFGLAMALIFAFRFFIEFTKETQVEFEKSMMLDMGQWLSIPFVILGLTFIVLSLKRDKNATV